MEMHKFSGVRMNRHGQINEDQEKKRKTWCEIPIYSALAWNAAVHGPRICAAAASIYK